MELTFINREDDDFCLSQYKKDLEIWSNKVIKESFNLKTNGCCSCSGDRPGVYTFKCLTELPCDMKKFKKKVIQSNDFFIHIFNCGNFRDSTYTFLIGIKDHRIEEMYHKYNTAEKVLVELLKMIRSIDDCHYIEETINTVDKYTGIRTYGPRRDLL